MESFPTTRLGGVIALVAAIVGASVRRRGDRVQVIDDWIRRKSAGGEAVIVKLPLKQLLVVSGPDLSAHVLADPPSAESYTVGKLKQSGMAFLAPRALTISDDDDWLRRREFNEQVLCTGQPHRLRQAFLDQVYAAFTSSAVTSRTDIRDRMGELMVGVVVGAPGGGLPDDVDRLMGVVRSPVKRALFGRRHRKRRRRFYEALSRHWAEAPDDTLVGSARTLTGTDSDETIEQVPHWMFTFTGSGTDLLTRTIALVGSRPEVRERVIAEVSASGPIDDAETIGKLAYVEACLRETGRLFPPVTTTFHVAPRGDEFNGRSIPAGMEILHYFPALERHGRNDADDTVRHFRPDRWNGTDADDADADAVTTSNLFLSGARSCPGEDLMMFVCKAALAIAVGVQGVRADERQLAADPLPRTVSWHKVRLHV